MARSTARKRALNTLYEADEKGQDFLSLLAERIKQPGAQTPLPDYAIEIVRGVADHRREIDRMLNDHSTGWKVWRMAVVDRNILRIAAWEIIYNDDVPDRVAIDEALDLAKLLSDEHSLAFIHGLLSAISDDDEARTQLRRTADANGQDDASHQDGESHEDTEDKPVATDAADSAGADSADDDGAVDFEDMSFDDVSVDDAHVNDAPADDAAANDGESVDK
ncbi:transcription antitermination factor NusB [Bifidobacterium leontopitheci]|uniref:Transcription antitermination protein NusB n=1 Tax=Bifidobacterium leontopitheci TaxID=2650774 RepID=A0A6I1GP53_9BIFI|nr:transcription antitermination factor NusB [Bifidobacterium leontopitheci]KAB7791169.1 nitrogen utilization protein B [Bifidobacterium leontopitheci]